MFDGLLLAVAEVSAGHAPGRVAELNTSPSSAPGFVVAQIAKDRRIFAALHQLREPERVPSPIPVRASPPDRRSRRLKARKVPVSVIGACPGSAAREQVSRVGTNSSEDLTGADHRLRCPPGAHLSHRTVVPLMLDASQCRQPVLYRHRVSPQFLNLAVPHPGQTDDDDVTGGTKHANKVLCLAQAYLRYPRGPCAVLENDLNGRDDQAPQTYCGRGRRPQRPEYRLPPDYNSDSSASGSNH